MGTTTMPYDGVLIWMKTTGQTKVPHYVSREDMRAIITEHIKWLMKVSVELQEEKKPPGKVIPFRRP